MWPYGKGIAASVSLDGFPGILAAEDTDGIARIWPLRDMVNSPAWVEIVGTIDRRIFFRNGDSLWVTDETEQGTTRLSDRSWLPPIEQEFRRPLPDAAVFGDHLIYRAMSLERGQELWVSDGTWDGTHLLLDLWPGEGSGQVDPHGGMALLGNTLFVSGSDGGFAGVELGL